MVNTSKYVCKQPDSFGHIDYTDEENQVWHDLITRQATNLPGRACREYQSALLKMDFPTDKIPQLKQVSEVLLDHTGWSVVGVPALIEFTHFFQLLASRQFPAATFIRHREDIDYLQEPDIFHELFGHTPLLTDSRFAAFSENYGKTGLAADKSDHAMLARLFWFTVEFGLINNNDQLRTYGAGVVSSLSELHYALESDVPQRKTFDPLEALRTPYRIDILQPVYFVIDDFDQLFELAQMDLLPLIKQAKQMGMHKPTY